MSRRVLGTAADEPSVDIRLRVNGIEVDAHVPVRLSATELVRNHLGLTGTHIGCEQGVCGMCTVIVDGDAVKSCLMLAAQLTGHEVETVESLAPDGELSALQERFKEHHALQCGFCTPGFLMTATALARASTAPSAELLREELCGVMCRCTGYAGILEAVEEYLSSGLPA